jgi:hypothetical protein
MIRKVLPSITPFIVFLLFIFFAHLSSAQQLGFSGVIINGQPIETECSKWLKESSHIKVKGFNEEIMVELDVDPNSKSVKVTSPSLPVDIRVNDSPCESKNSPFRILVNDTSCGEVMDMPSGIKIKKYKVAIKKSDGECISIDVRLNSKLQWSVADLLLLPVVYKVLIKKPCQILFGGRNSIVISPKAS